jgi:serine/threonine protein kinase
MPRGEPAGTRAADIYSLGMVLYVIFTGQSPEMFPSIATALVKDTSSEDFLRVNSVILRACEYDRKLRYASVREMSAALREAEAALESDLAAQPLS